MEYLVTRSVALKTDVKWLGNDWAICEIENGKSLPELVPYYHQVYFDVISLDYSLTTTTDCEKYTDGKNEVLSGYLKPQKNINGKANSYSFAGTDRLISTFCIIIEKAKQGDICECLASGNIATKTDATTPFDGDDNITFWLYLKEEAFNDLVLLTKEEKLYNLRFEAFGVEGLYSEWHPSYKVQDFKVLIKAPHIKIDVPTNCSFEPQFLEKISSAKIVATKNNVINVEPIEVSLSNDSKICSTDYTSSLLDLRNIMVAQNSLLRKITTVLWIMTTLLLIILVTNGMSAN